MDTSLFVTIDIWTYHHYPLASLILLRVCIAIVLLTHFALLFVLPAINSRVSQGIEQPASRGCGSLCIQSK